MGGRFSWRNWWRFYRALAQRREPRELREVALRAGLAIAAEAGWRLDRPAPPPDRVLLVVGHQRSGTTWLHRLLAAQPGACALPLHGLLLPADAWQWLFTSGALPENPHIRMHIGLGHGLAVQRPAVDQLGQSRPAQAPGDIGAIESR